MGIVLELFRIHLVWAAFFGDKTLELVTAATYQYQAKFQAFLVATIFLIRRFQSFFLHLVRMRNGA